MHRLILLAVALAVTCEAHADIRLWLSSDGVAENEPISGTPVDFVSFGEGSVPVLRASDGLTRLYLWGSYDVRGTYAEGIILDVRLMSNSPDVAFVGSRWYNYTVPDLWNRWTHTLHGDVQPNLVGLFGGLSLRDGGGLRDAPHDVQYDAATQTMLLGYVDVATALTAQAQLYFAIRNPFLIMPPWARVYFGWGDESLAVNDVGQQSRLPDAIIIPEPASALLTLALAALARSRGRLDPTRRARRHAPPARGCSHAPAPF